MNATEVYRKKRIMHVVNKQAENEALWFDAVYITEDYLQRELRELHAVIREVYGVDG